MCVCVRACVLDELAGCTCKIRAPIQLFVSERPVVMYGMGLCLAVSLCKLNLLHFMVV